VVRNRLRYERTLDDDIVDSVERDWLLRWFVPGEMSALANAAGLDVTSIVDEGGARSNEDVGTGSFLLRRTT
jgi:hypothetical protein